MKIVLKRAQVLAGSVHLAGAELDLDTPLAEELINQDRAKPVAKPASTADEKPASRKQSNPVMLSAAPGATETMRGKKEK
jgi:hypothetical protein